MELLNDEKILDAFGVLLGERGILNRDERLKVVAQRQLDQDRADMEALFAELEKYNDNTLYFLKEKYLK